MKSNIEFDAALNNASWKALSHLQDAGVITSGALFNNLKTALKIAIDTYIDESAPVPKVPKPFERGDRVVVNETSGFNKGAKGVIEFVETSGKLWVLRDGSSSPCYFHPTELDFE